MYFILLVPPSKSTFNFTGVPVQLATSVEFLVPSFNTLPSITASPDTISHPENPCLSLVGVSNIISVFGVYPPLISFDNLPPFNNTFNSINSFSLLYNFYSHQQLLKKSFLLL